jgi:hypothetical protein
VRALVAGAVVAAMVAVTFGWPVVILGYHLWRGQ